MKSDTWMAFYVGDYVANTMHLTARQHGAYLLLICAAWKAAGALPATDAALASIAKLSPREWRQDGDTLKAFLTWQDGHWIHERVTFEWNEAHRRTGDKSKAGKAGARKRWDGRGNGSAIADPLPTQWQPDAPSQSQSPSQYLTPTPSVANSAQAREPVSRSQLITEEWEPTQDDKAALAKELPWLTGELYASRMRDFRDWCDANATMTFNPAATWRGFMRKTKPPNGGMTESYDDRRIRLIREAIRS